MKEFKKFVKTEDSKKQDVIDTANKFEKEGMKIPEEAIKNTDFNPDDINLVKNLTEKYSGNKDMLVNDIVKLANKNRKEGKLNDEQLDNIEEKLTPMLNDKQKKMMKNIMGMLKKT